MSIHVSDQPRTKGPDAATGAFADLRRTVNLLGEELAGFRKRAQTAEARVRELEKDLKKSEERAIRAEVRAEAPASPDQISVREAELARENEQLRRRLGVVTKRVRVLLERLRFIREQESQ